MALETLSPSRASDFKTCPQLFKFRAVDRLRDRILSLSGEAGEGQDMDWSVVSQGELFALGTKARGPAASTTEARG